METYPMTLTMLGKMAARKRPTGKIDPTAEAIDPNDPRSSLLSNMNTFKLHDSI